MKRVFVVPAVLMLLGFGIVAQANITIDTVRVGDAGNSDDWTGYGSVAYDYNIGKYEVTAGQYTALLNAKATTDTHALYNSFMSDSRYGCGIVRSGTSGNYTYSVVSGFANRPVNFVSFWDSCRFANWLSNGQGNGDTETGTYTLNGYNGSEGYTIERNSGSTWAVTSENEWYKAAFYKGGGTNSAYWSFPTASHELNSSMANIAYSVGHTSDVGSYSSNPSPYGTYDQGGNVWEWNEAVIYGCRGVRGGAYDYDASSIDSWNRYDDVSSVEYDFLGFRVSEATTAPEPESFVVLAGGLLGLIVMRRRKV